MTYHLQTRAHSRSALHITDHSKKGTLLDGVRFTQEAKVLDRDQHVFKLGHDERQYK